jgi:hypothetical protein
MTPRTKHLLIAGAGVLLATLLAQGEYRIVSGLLAAGSPWSAILYDRSMIWLGALGTLAVYSFLIRENPFYKAFEYALLGCATGMGIAIVLQDALLAKCLLPLRDGFTLLLRDGPTAEAMGGVALIVPALIGMLWFFQFSKGLFWLSRIPMVIGLGAGAGLAFKDLFNRMLPQITGTAKSLWPGEWILPGATFAERASAGFENLVFVAGTLSVLVYFFFTVSRKRLIVRGPAALGRWYLMLSLGAFFGNTFMSRLSALIERVHFLCSQWLGLSKPW